MRLSSRLQALTGLTSEARDPRSGEGTEHVLGGHPGALPIGSHLDHDADDRVRVLLEELDQVVVRTLDADAMLSQRPGREVSDVPGDDRARPRTTAAAAWTRSSGSCPGIEAMRCS